MTHSSRHWFVCIGNVISSCSVTQEQRVLLRPDRNISISTWKYTFFVRCNFLLFSCFLSIFFFFFFLSPPVEHYKISMSNINKMQPYARYAPSTKKKKEENAKKIIRWVSKGIRVALSLYLIRLQSNTQGGWGRGQKEAKQLIVFSAWHLISTPQKVYYRSKTVIKP